jgi:two-component system sensor histidine kinase DesK
MAGSGPAAPTAAGEASRRASVLPVAVLGLLLADRMSDVLQYGSPGQVPFTAALFVIPMLYAVPVTGPVVWRYRWLALAVQGVLTWVPFAVFGAAWQAGIGGLLAGLVLLVVPGRAAWLLAGMLLAGDVVVRATVTGLPEAPGWFGVIHSVTFYVIYALEFFAMVRLAQIVGQVEQARAAAAGVAVAQERLAAAQELRVAIGEQLAGIAVKAAVAQRDLSRDMARARGQIAAAGAAARDAIAQARAVTARYRGPAGPEPAVPPPGGAVIAARLAWTVLVVVLLSFATYSVSLLVYYGYGTGRAALAITDIVLVTALQLYHSWSVRAGARPRAWPVTLGLQAVLVYAFLFPFVDAYVGVLGPFLAGSVLLLVRGRWRWAGYAAVAVSWSVLLLTLPLRGVTVPAGQRIPATLQSVAAAAGVGLLVYGLAWLAGLAAQLEGLRGELARVAVVGERLRIARDVHDLLGLGLSAIALKADLAARLIGRDDARAAAELAEMTRICASARAEVRLVAGGGQRLSLVAELAAARQILTSAGVQVRADVRAGPLPEAVDGLLATVLREAVTNILRHSAAVTCSIEAAAGDGTVRLGVSNDGIADQPGGGDVLGHGLANLTARLHAAGGHLASRQADGRFELAAEIPLGPAT